MNKKESIAKRVYKESYKKLCDDKKRIVDTIFGAGGLELDRFVEISKYSLGFSKIVIAILFWIALIFQLKILILLSFVLILMSVVMKIEYTPLLYVYDKTVENIFKTQKETYDRKAVKFANLMGAILCFIGIIFLFFINSYVGWVIVFCLALFKTASSFGFCGGIKIYNCMTHGCCVFKYQKKLMPKKEKNK